MKPGVNDQRRVECKRSKYHGFYPEDEGCPLCDEETPIGSLDQHGYWTWDGLGAAQYHKP